MRRREFIILLGGAVTAWPLIARAQRLVTPVIGFLSAREASEAPQLLTAFRQGLKELGFVESQNIAIEYRFAGNQNDQLPALAADLVQRQVTVIVAVTTPAALAAKAATTTVPIVFQAGVDPVQIGLVASLNRPGGNVTGVSNLSIGLATKRIELMRQVMPDAKLIAVLVNPRDEPLLLPKWTMRERFKHNLVSGYISSKQAQSAISTPPSPKSSNSELARSPSAPTRSYCRPDEIASLATRYGVPAIHPLRAFAAAGGLMSYGSDFADTYKLAGAYVGRILKGEKPENLPVQQSTKVELIINLKTAKVLRLTIPEPLLGRADEVIE